MWKTLFVPLFVVLLGAASVYADFKSTCPATKSSCNSEYVRTKIKQYGKRAKPCTFKHETDCKTFASASQGCVNGEKLYGDAADGKCRTHGIERDVECWAKAAASAFASASVFAECTGKGEGCIEARVEASATACSVAEAIVNVTLYSGKTNDPACQSAVDAVVVNIASAGATAMASACSSKNKPGMAKDFQFSSEVKSVISKAFASCWVYCEKVDDKEVEKPVSAGGAEVTDTSPPANVTSPPSNTTDH